MKRLLLIEDNADVRDWIGEALRRDYSIDSAGNYAEGLRKMRDGKFDLLILDLKLPDSEIEQTVERMPMLKAVANCPILVTTGHPSRVSGNVLCDGMLYKPFNTSDLLEAVRLATRPKTTCMMPALMALIRQPTTQTA